MPPYKPVAQYEAEAAWVDGCLVHPANGASRAVYYRRHGKLPKGVYVCHTCDNGACIRDLHHFPGTQKVNMQDASKKGRLVRSEETRRKMGVAKSGRVVTRATGEKLARMSAGLWQNEEYIEKQMKVRSTAEYKAKQAAPRPNQTKGMLRHSRRVAKFEEYMGTIGDRIRARRRHETY